MLKLLSLFCFSQVTSLELSTGLPLLYIYKDRKFMRRGSPVGPTEAGVYAYTKVNQTKPNQLFVRFLDLHVYEFPDIMLFLVSEIGAIQTEA